MRVEQVITQVRNVSEAEAFYRDALQLPVSSSGKEAQVAIGESSLILREDPGSDVTDHFAFDVPPGRLTDAVEWLTGRGIALLSQNGETEFESTPDWNARSVYFAGPSRSVLEFIERRDLDESLPGPFGPAGILRISEVGVASEDVAADRRRLEEYGVTAYAKAGSDVFRPMGDIHGLLILVAAERPWLPTEDRLSAMSPLDIEIGGMPGPVDVGIGAARVHTAGA